ncbi:MAG: hypothetical protein LQ349_003082 [Xanthoria aureola]|nr:MAG: hypothetical protein LQ349_003082 [Xanthoria aureola]
MGFVNLIHALWKNKADTMKQRPTVRNLGISSPLPQTLPQQDTQIGLDLLEHSRLKRAAHVRRPNEPPQELYLPQRSRRIAYADFDADGDLGLQGGPHRIGELYREHEVHRADSGYATDNYIDSLLGGEVQDVKTSSIGQTPASKKPKEDPFEGRVEPSKVCQDGNESGIFGSVTRRPTIPQRNPRRIANLVPSDLSFTQISQATLCGSIKSNGKYEIEESSFKKDFRWIRDIGEGGFGKVELRQHKTTGQLLALKTTRSVVDYIDNIPAEVYIIRDILGNVHSNLPKLYHFNHSLAQIECWMEYCDGGDLVTFEEHHVLNQTLIPEGFLWHTLTSLTSALAFLHTGVDRSDPDRPPPPNWRPILHRDIKPDNVFLKLPTRPCGSSSSTTKYPTLVLGDFGLATPNLSDRSRKYYIGTPAYQPPQLPLHTIYSDIWAAGAIVHYLAVGAPPIAPQPYYDSRTPDEFECDPSVRLVQDVTCVDDYDGGTEGGYSAVLKEYLGMWLCWEEARRPSGLRGCLRAEAGRLMFLAEGGVEEGVGMWERWVRRGEGGVAVRTENGARGF